MVWISTGELRLGRDRAHLETTTKLHRPSGARLCEPQRPTPRRAGGSTPGCDTRCGSQSRAPVVVSRCARCPPGNCSGQITPGSNCPALAPIASACPFPAVIKALAVVTQDPAGFFHVVA